jgi:hypothetical protein
MDSQPGAVDWELIVGRDLIPHLLPAGRPRGVYRPADVTWLPEGAYTAIVESIGRVGLEDLLVVPAVAWPAGSRRCLYSPQCIAAIGERGVGLWAQALPAPGVRVQVPFGEIAAIEHRANGPRRLFVVTGRAGRLAVRYDADGQAVVDAWTRRLRQHAAVVPAPVPPHPDGRAQRGRIDPRSLLLDRGDAVVSAGWRSRVGSGECLLGVTSRELVIGQSLRDRRWPWSVSARMLYVPRGSIEDAVARSKTVLMRSAGTDVRIAFRSRRAAAVASSWLSWVLSDHGRLGSAGPPRAR